MYDRIIEYEVRPRQEKVDDFSKAITTRLMVKRGSGSEERRRSSLSFAPGSFIPNTNTIIRRTITEINDEETVSNTCSQITVTNLKDYKAENTGKMTESGTAETSVAPLQKLRESVRRRSRSSGSEAGSRRLSGQSESVKSERRVSMRTTTMQPAEVRRSSPESLRKTINNAAQEVELLDVDDLVDSEKRLSKSKSTSSKVSFRRDSDESKP